MLTARLYSFLPGLIPVIKTLPAAGAGSALRNLVGDQRHHVAACGQFRQQVLADILDGRQTGHIGGFQRPDHRVAAAERGAHHFVDHLRRSDAALNDMQRFAQQGEL